MQQRMIKILHIYFGNYLDLRVRIFNVLAATGFIVSLIEGVVNLFSGAGLLATVSVLASAVLSAALLIFAQRTQRYRLCYLITIVVIFIGLFTYLFFDMGGYHGGSTTFVFVFCSVHRVYA